MEWQTDKRVLWTIVALRGLQVGDEIQEEWIGNGKTHVVYVRLTLLRVGTIYAAYSDPKTPLRMPSGHWRLIGWRRP